MTQFSRQKRRIKVLDSYMTYLDSRAGEHTVVFLHGNPTSSYLWRNVIPQVQGVARCVAPDLIGMGDSGKQPKGRYRFFDHYKYLDAWFDELNLPGKIVLVVHDWGSALGFHWAYNHQKKIEAIVHMESFVAPFGTYEDLGTKIAQDFFKRMRNAPGAEDLVLKNNYFLEMCLAGMTINKKLTEMDLKEYRKPFETPGEFRRPTLVGVQDMPIIEDGPNDVIEAVREYSDWLSRSHDLPKLYINAEPGLFSPWIQSVMKDWPNQQTVTVAGRHFLQEESAAEIGKSITNFIKKLDYMHYGASF